MKPIAAAGLALLAVCCAAPGQPGSAATDVDVVFDDATREARLGYSFDRARGGGHFMPDSLAGGCALFDYDNDGDLDAYVVLGLFEEAAVHADGANRLFRQEPDGSFTDVSAASGAADPGYGMGVAVGDIDNDGDADLFVSNYGPNALYRNNGDGTFSDITEPAGVGDPRWGASAGFFDFDGDGFLDLFVSNYLQYRPGPDVRDAAGRPEYAGPECCPGTADILYRNNGDGTFRDISAQAGIAEARGKGLGVGFADLDGDGRTDVFVANDGEANRAWVHDGAGGLRDAARPLGVALNGFGGAEASMGVVVADLNGDARSDLFLTHLFQETNTLYLAGEGGRFADATFGSGLGKQSADSTGFGAAPLDIDRDGRPELAVVNGRVLRATGYTGNEHWPPYAEANLLFWNEGDGRFREAGEECGPFCDVDVGRGLAVGDVDNDGDLDLLATTADGRVRLLRNVHASDAHWIGFRLTDTTGPRDATGAVVEVRAGAWTLRGIVAPAQSYLSSHDPRLLFGLGAAGSIDRLSVRWPDGSEELFDATGIDRYHELIRGEGNPG